MQEILVPQASKLSHSNELTNESPPTVSMKFVFARRAVTKIIDLYFNPFTFFCFYNVTSNFTFCTNDQSPIRVFSRIPSKIHSFATLSTRIIIIQRVLSANTSSSLISCYRQVLFFPFFHSVFQKNCIRNHYEAFHNK